LSLKDGSESPTRGGKGKGKSAGLPGTPGLPTGFPVVIAVQWGRRYLRAAQWDPVDIEHVEELITAHDDPSEFAHALLSEFDEQISFDLALFVWDLYRGEP
jgi:hypothetical protein